MDKMKRFIDIYVPVTTCNFRCHYCYITHNGLFANKLPHFPISPESFRKALSRDRLGGVCLLNFCGGGETLLPSEVVDYVRAALEEGHYVMVVTNGTVTKAFNRFAEFPKSYLSRLFFKFSFHFQQLEEHKLFDRFFANVRMMRDAGASFTIELTPIDEMIPRQQELKEMCLREVGAIPHATVARDQHDMAKLPLLSKLSEDEYKKVWQAFSSKLFDFKLSVFGKKRREFCYAGDWAAYLNLGTGEMTQCNCALTRQNIFTHIEKPIQFKPIGHFCRLPHCYNAHVWLTLGCIPELKTPTYADMRNRCCADGTEWLKPQMKAFLSQKLADNNKPYSSVRRIIFDGQILVKAFCSRLYECNVSVYAKFRRLLLRLTK